ncbi:MAG: hypothetical protein ACXW1R_08480, partial [Halobacteriota archaeon]
MALTCPQGEEESIPLLWVGSGPSLVHVLGRSGHRVAQGRTTRSYETVEDACSVATDVLSGSIDPNAGCGLIAAIAAKLNYPPALEPFTAIAHDQ